MCYSSICNGITVEAAEDLTLEQKAIYQEYKEDVEFKKMVEKYGDEYIKEYIDDVISARIVENEEEVAEIFVINMLAILSR